MKKKKGFTLVELIAVIALIGVVLTIAGLAVSSISTKVKQSQYEELETLIRVNAEKYLVKTGIQRVYVRTLINEGYIEADDDSGEIYNPVTKESIICHYYDMSLDAPVLKEGDCSNGIIEEVIVGIKYCLDPNCSQTYNLENKWYNLDKIYLKAVSYDSNMFAIEDSDVSYKWISPLAPDVYDSSKYHEINMENGYVNSVYEVILTKGNKTYNTSIKLQNDVVAPVVSRINVTDLDIYKQNKVLTADITDNESGLDYYLITTSSEVPTEGWIKVNGNTKKVSKTITENGTWYVWVKDKAGNTNVKTINNNKIEVSKIDNVAPICTVSGQNSVWTKDKVTITYGCKDEGEGASGCNEMFSGGVSVYNSTTKTAVIPSYTIKDKVGNSTSCPSTTVSVYVDTTLPEIDKFTIASKEEYNSKNVNIQIKGTDTNSGLNSICISKVNNSNNCNWKSYTSGTYLTSYTFNANEGDGTSFVLYAFIKDKAGNISLAQSKTYSLYAVCSKKEIYQYGKYGTCSVTCGGGLQYRDVYYRDRYLHTHCNIEKNGDSQSCGNVPCCDEGTYEDYMCGNNGYVVQRRYNECLGKYETRETTKACKSEHFDCSWSGCDQNGYKYQICKYNQGGLTTNEIVGSDTCKSGYYNCNWSSCDSNGFIKEYCSYQNGGVEYTEESGNTSTCQTEYYDCEWTACDSEGYSYKTCKYKEGGQEFTKTEVDKKTCKTDYYDCQWSGCGEDGYNHQSCQYKEGGIEYTEEDVSVDSCYDTFNKTMYVGCDSYYITTCEIVDVQDGVCAYTKKNDANATGTVLRSSLLETKPEKCFCNISGNNLFGSSGSYERGNKGDTVYVNKYWEKNWCGPGKCDPALAYHRICIKDACGIYKGMTAVEINKKLGCTYDKYWCSCSDPQR